MLKKELKKLQLQGTECDRSWMFQAGCGVVQGAQGDFLLEATLTETSLTKLKDRLP